MGEHCDPDPAAHGLAHPRRGRSLDEQAQRLADQCRPGREEIRAVVLRRAAAILLWRAHGKPAAYRGAAKGPYAVPLRWPMDAEA